ncbi:MAG: PACE efflux transporter, partial [Gammaproteobacteria bacterium]|nr:PACE efflux transporter [Gammaproteobacteria bacterium]
RTGKDRLRYTSLFEFFLILMLAPMGALVFDRHLFDIGMLSIVLSLKAMIFNLIYNWFFDLMDVRAGRIPTRRTISGRILHAAGFEAGLVLTSLPIVMWWLGFTLWEAFLMDVIVTSFVVVYTFVFTWSYDLFYPVEQRAMVARS